ncbi:MAG TPA: hypothetical protein VL595_05260 [Pseudonocardia sp.]|jgi:hypothetical protein|nr:hypothetical protein [Pseudonocardia sp.]
MTGTQIPSPPAGLVMDQTYQAVFTVAMFAAIAALFTYAVVLLRKERTPVPLLLMAGGAAAMLCEPIVDVLGLCVFPSGNQWTLFKTFDRPIPMFILVYIWFVGGQALLVWRTLQRGGGPKAVWRWLMIFFAIDVTMETIAVRVFGLYVLYGKQPFQILGLPWWWILVNATMPVVTGVVVYKTLPWLTGPKVLGVIALVPMCDAAVNASTSFAMWNVLNSDAGYVTTYAVGVVTIGLTLFLVWLAAMSTREPAPVEARVLAEHRG